MSYLYLARYHRTTGKFELNTGLGSENRFSRVLYHLLAGFTGTPDPPKASESSELPEAPEVVEFYIAYHPDIEFYKKHKRKVFCQYVFLRSKEDPALNLSFEGEYFLDSGFNPSPIDQAGKSADPGHATSFCSLKPYPILHITSLDLFDSNLFKGTYYKVPRYIRLLDSSIWNLYVPVKKADFLTRFETAIQKIVEYQCLYSLKVVRENADFRARLAYNSYLSGGDHADNVVPFLFHSETEMKESRIRNIDKVKKYAGALEWRILVIDDHAETPMSGPDHPVVIKKDIIEKRLNEIKNAIHAGAEDEPGPGPGPFIFDSAQSIKIAKGKLKKNRYDIIFIDYLLGKKNEGGREYGYELLKDIYHNPSHWRDSKGIYDRFWFFNISSFSHTIEERLREQGMAYYSSHWNFARGASPLITPELFLYELSRFLSRQIEVMTELPMSNSKRKTREWENKHKRIITLTDLLEAIYQTGTGVSVRRRAAYFFDSVLTLKANYNILQEDLKKGSLLIPSLFPDIKHYNNAFWEHLMHLVYVTAYGSVRQWPELWDEFLFIKPHLPKTRQGENVIELIERHLIALKNGNR